MQDFVPAVSNNDVGGNLAGNWTLGIIAKRNAWNPKDSRLFLHTATIGDNHPGIHVQVKKLKMAKWLCDPQASRLRRH